MNLLLWYWGRRGGTPRLTCELADTLRRTKDDRIFLSLSRQSELFAETDEFAIPALHVDTYKGPASALFSLVRLPLVAARLYRFARQVEVEVAICMMRHLWGPAAFFALHRAGARVLLILHDALQHPGEQYPFSKPHLKLDLSMTDGIVVLSEHVGEIAVREMGYPRERIWRLRHPSMHFGKARAEPRELPGDRPIRLLFFGRLLEYKGLDILAEAFLEISRRHDVTLRIVGHGSAPGLAKLADLPNTQIENRWVGEAQIGDVLDEADLLVAPYRDASQSGIVPAAFAAALPVVATPVGGLVEQVRDGINGVLAAGVRPADFARALDRLLRDPELYSKCSAGALATSRNEFSVASLAEGLCAAARAVSALPPRK